MAKRPTPPGFVQTSFHASEENYEWLRATAFTQRTSQAKLLNRAIETLRAISEGRLQEALAQASPDAEKPAAETAGPDEK